MKESKQFYQDLSKLALPIIIQNLLSTAIGTADTLMLNVVGQNEMAAVSLANQVYFILNLFFVGLNGGTGILMAQYLGKKQADKVSDIFSMAFRMAGIVCVIFSGLTFFCPEILMMLLTNDATLISLGCDYLRIAGVSYLVLCFIEPYLITLKTSKQSGKSMLISSFTLCLNFFLNAVFIFGIGGVPKLGIKGVALATLIARLAELAICFVDFRKSKMVRCSWSSERSLWKKFFEVSSPMALQGFAWGGAMAVMSAIMGHLGADVVAANSVASVIQSIATVACFGLADAGAILLGNDLGSEQFEVAKNHGASLLKIAIVFGIAGCSNMLFAEVPIRSMLTLTETAEQYFHVMYLVLAINAIFAAITYTILCGILPSGGATKYCFILDGVVMWTLVVLGSIAAFVLKLEPLMVFLILNIDELVKTPLVLMKYHKGDWIKNLTISEEK